MISYKKNLIHALQSFSEIPDDLAGEIGDLFKPREYKSGDFYLKADEEPTLFSFVLSGLFRYFYITRDGEEYTKHFSMENSLVISLSAFLEQRKSYFYIEAIEDSIVFAADMKQLMDMSENNIYLTKFMLKLIKTVFIMKEKREADFLLKDALGRYEQFLLDYPGLEKRVRQYHIATYLGITPVSLSRIRKKHRPSEIS